MRQSLSNPASIPKTKPETINLEGEELAQLLGLVALHSVVKHESTQSQDTNTDPHLFLHGGSSQFRHCLGVPMRTPASFYTYSALTTFPLTSTLP